MPACLRTILSVIGGNVLKTIKKWFGRLLMGLGFLVFLSLALGIIATLAEEAEHAPPKNIILALNLDQPLAESHGQDPLSFAVDAEHPLLTEVLDGLLLAADDPRVKGLVARFGDAEPSLAQAQEIRAALARFRAKGKFAYAYAYSFGEAGTAERSYLLASAFDEIWMQPRGSVNLSGLRIESPYGRALLDRLGVRPEIEKREAYKSAMENFTERTASPAARENLESLLGNLWKQITTAVAVSRKLDPAKAESLLGNGPYTGAEAIRHKLIDRLAYADELEKHLKEKAGKDSDFYNFFEYLNLDHSAPHDLPLIALIKADGAILTDTEEDGEGRISGINLADAIKDAAEDKDVKAILLRVNSPGGSPVGSEIIRRAFIHARENKKPIVVSMGDVAGSGGYWIAMDADRIVANPATLTGSIGVIGGKINLAGLWPQLSIGWESFDRGHNASFWSSLKGYTPETRVRLNALLDDTYDAFVKNVAAARKIPEAKARTLAGGRVYTGEQAKALGLADALGGYETADAELRTLLKLPADQAFAYQLYPAPVSPAERAIRLLRRFGLAAAQINTFTPLITGLTPYWEALSPVKSLTMPQVNLQ